jgi:mannose-6-phosphate isomerase-like protein (cupin superfamily)
MSAAEIRRVVLGTDPNGATVVRSDGPAPSVTELPAVPGTALVDLWRSTTVPLDPAVADDPTAGAFELMPAGSLFRVIDLGPTGDAEPMWHRTDSVDFIYVARGSATCVFEGGSVELTGGDTIVVQAVRHAWINPTDEVSRLVDVSVASVPPRA